MCIYFCCLSIHMTHDGFWHWQVHSTNNSKCYEGMPTGVWCGICNFQFLHGSLKVPVCPRYTGFVSGVWNYQFLTSGFSGGFQKLLIVCSAVLTDWNYSVFALLRLRAKYHMVWIYVLINLIQQTDKLVFAGMAGSRCVTTACNCRNTIGGCSVSLPGANCSLGYL